MFLEWRDAHSVIGWISPDEAPPLAIIRTVGIILREDDKTVTVTNSLNEYRQGADPLTIPKNWVVRRESLAEIHF